MNAASPTPLADALARRRQAEHDIAVALRREYPVGAHIVFVDHGGRERVAVVTGHCFGERVQVETCDTRRSRKLYAAMLRGRAA